MKKSTVIPFILAFLMVVVIFLVLSAILMALWNTSVKKSFGPGIIAKINYPTAMGLTFLLMLFSGGAVVIMRK